MAPSAATKRTSTGGGKLDDKLRFALAASLPRRCAALPLP